MSATNDNCLILNNGQKICSISELYSTLKTMKNSTFNYHVNGERNDFYLWVKHALNDNSLADDLLECTNKEAVMFCLATNLGINKKYVNLSGPLFVDRENDKFSELPRGYSPKYGARDLSHTKDSASAGLAKLIKQNNTKSTKGLVNVRKVVGLPFKISSNKLAIPAVSKGNKIVNIIEQLKEVFEVE